MAASGLSAEGVAISLPFQLLYKSSIIPHFATIILISLVIAGVIATVMSTADTVIIAFIARLIKIDRFSETLSEARRKAILVVIVVLITANILYSIEQRIATLIFMAYTAQLVFFRYFGDLFCLEQLYPKIKSDSTK